MEKTNITRAIVVILLAGVLTLVINSILILVFWNFAVAPAVNLPTLTFWQSAALYALCRVLFTNSIEIKPNV